MKKTKQKVKETISSYFTGHNINLDKQRIKLINDKSTIHRYTLEEIKNSIICGDAFEVLKKFSDEIFDMVFIDPPYFLQLSDKELKRWGVKTKVEGVNDDWDKFKSFEEYDEFIKNLLLQTKRVMKHNATLWIISTYHSIFRIGKILQDLGYWILNDVIWIKTNPMPKWLGVRFTNATETLIWAVKDKNVKKYTFNRNYAKIFGYGKIGTNVWILPICSGKERLKDETGRKCHSTQKPIELLKRVILTSTKENDLILDPMSGVGTTGYVANALKRNFVMIEKNSEYVKWTLKRFEKKLDLNVEDKLSRQLSLLNI